MSRKHETKPVVRGPTMKLRLPAIRKTFVETTVTPPEALARRGGHLLTQSDDYYNCATP